jgi:hypothetical protein
VRGQTALACTQCKLLVWAHARLLQRPPGCFDALMHISTKESIRMQAGLGRMNNKSIRCAIARWLKNQRAAAKFYGPISEWDTGEVTDVRGLFTDAKDFDEDLQKWDLSNVKTYQRNATSEGSHEGSSSMRARQDGNRELERSQEIGLSPALRESHLQSAIRFYHEALKKAKQPDDWCSARDWCAARKILSKAHEQYAVMLDLQSAGDDTEEVIGKDLTKGSRAPDVPPVRGTWSDQRGARKS